MTFHVDVPYLDPNLLKDSNACGDSFVGGFLARICQFEDSEEH